MSKLRSRRPGFSAAIALAVALAAPLAGSTAAAARTAASAATTASHAQATARFPVFAQAAQPSDTLPANSAYTGGTARRITARGQPFTAWAVLRGAQLCVTLNAPTGPAAGGPAACNSIARLSQPGQYLILTAATTPAAPQIIAGLIPRSISSVTLTTTSGQTTVIPVTRNGFAAAIPGGQAPRLLRIGTGTAAEQSISLATRTPAISPAYTGEFCYGVLLNDGNTCTSNTESNIRRAIGHGSDYTFIEVDGGGLNKSGSCKSDGCTADTGYLSHDVTGHGIIENSGPCNCNGDYFGYLYS
jgi:hypothetical protein